MSLEERLERLEAKVAIEELRSNYCYHVDEANGTAFASLFTEDGVLDFESAGTFTGRAELREFVDEVVPETYSFIVHMLHNPIVEVDGGSATGRWYFEAPCTADGEDMWIQGRYDDEYERHKGEWRFSTVTVRFNYVADYHEGWGGD